MKKNLLLFLMTGLLIPVAGFAQYINSVTVKSGSSGLVAIADLHFTSAPASRIGYSATTRNDSVLLTACYATGPLTTTSHVIDTIQLGTFAPGNYTLFFKAYRSGNPTQCDSSSFAVFTQNFTANTTLGLPKQADARVPEIYPNPANDQVRIISSPLSQVTLRDLSGKRMLSVDLQGETSVQLDIAALPKGFYLLETITRQGHYFRQHLLKN